MKLWALLLADIRQQARQGLALLALVVVPLVGAPGALLAYETWSGSIDTSDKTGEERKELPVWVSPEIVPWVTEDQDLRLVSEPSFDAQDPPLAIARLVDRQVVVSFQPEKVQSTHARNRLHWTMSRRNMQRRQEQLADAGVEVSLHVVDIEVVDTASTESVGGNRVGLMLPGTLLFIMAMAGLYTAVDIVTGEKERGTAETILTTSTSRREITAAKLLGTTGAAGLSGLLGLISSLVLLLGAPSLIPAVSTGFSPSFTGLTVLTVVVFLLALQVSSVSLLIASWASDYRSASMLAGPAMLVMLAPAGLSALPTLELVPLTAAIPVANACLTARDALTGALTPGMGALVLAVVVGQTLAATALAAVWLERESSLLGSSGSGASRRELGRYGQDAATLFGLAFLSLLLFGAPAQARHVVYGHLFTQLILFFSAALAWLWWLGVPVLERASLRAAPPRAYVQAVGVGLATPVIAIGIGALQSFILPMPMHFGAEINSLFDTYGLAASLALFALLPAVCEEFLFRGALLGLLRGSVSNTLRVVLVAGLFACTHLSAHRLAPTFLLGLILGFLTLRTRSLLPAILLHFTHNAVSIGLVATDSLPESLAVIGPAATAVAAVGMFTMPVARRKPEK